MNLAHLEKKSSCDAPMDRLTPLAGQNAEIMEVVESSVPKAPTLATDW